MPALFLLPGFLGSEMTDPAFLGFGKVWVNYPSLAIGGFQALKLAPDGVSPDPSFGRQMNPGYPLHEYYDPCIAAMDDQLGKNGWRVIPWGYDWRQDIRTSGRQLAGLVQSFARVTDPCTIVGHSMGGLVARAAWYYLGLVGAQNLVRRIITLGTPHWGSYDTYDFMNGNESTQRQLADASSYSWGIQTPSPMSNGDDAYTATKKIVNSWPSMYQLLPTGFTTYPVVDLYRLQLFNPTFWDPSCGINPTLLADAATTWVAFLRDPATQPPPNILTCVAGVASGNVDTLLVKVSGDTVHPYRPGLPQDGDNKVASVNATLSTAGEFIRVPCSHQDLPNYLGTNGLLSQLIRQKNPVPSGSFTQAVLDFVAGVPDNLPLVMETDAPVEPGFNKMEFVQEVTWCMPILDDPPFPNRGGAFKIGFRVGIPSHC